MSSLPQRSALRHFTKSAALLQVVTNAAVKPVLECVVNNGGGSYTARFGYQNLNTANVTIPVGASNKFTPTPTDRGQTTTFLPGRQTFVFDVPFNGSNLVWSLKGPDNQNRTSTASSASAACVTNHPPVANAGPNQTVFLGATVQLNGTASTDVDGDPLTYRWSFSSVPSGSIATISGATTATPTFIVDKPGSYTVQLIVNDGKVDSTPSTVTISTQNSPPVANAGANQSVHTTQLVQLDGSRSSDVDGDPLTYLWSFVSIPSGSTAALSSATAVGPTFVTDKKGTYTIQLVVNDGYVNSSPAQVTITDVNTPPIANPGPNQTVTTHSQVLLDGSSSTDVDGDPLTFTWSILNSPAGSGAALSDSHAVKPSFTVDVLGSYIIQLIVNDGLSDSAPATVTISDINSPPVANAGPAQSIALGAQVTLNGTASSDVDGQTLTYAWSILSAPAGSTAALSQPTSATPFFTADKPGNYVIQLIVNDGLVSSQPATVVVSTLNSIPVANPGPNQTVTTGTTVQLDGSASTDADGDPLTYRWAILSQPASGTAVLSNALIANPTVVPNVSGLYVVQLIVNDGKIDSAPRTVTITVGTPVIQLAAPSATAGLPGQILSLTFLVTNTGVFDAQQVVFSSATNTLLGVIPAGQTQPAIVSFSVPSPAPKGSNETDASYLSHLQAADNQNLPVPGTVTWSDVAGHAYGPVTVATSVTEQLPVITVALSAPPTAKAASSINYTVTLTNAGHATGTVAALSLTMPDGSVQTPALTQTALAPGESVSSATVPFAIPVSQTGTIAVIAQASWLDGNSNIYGPVSATAVTQINGISPAILASCAPSGSLSVLIQNGNVKSYVPNGSWRNNTTGLEVVPLEGTGNLAPVATPNAVNSCSSNSVTGETVCTANNSDVYLLTDAALTRTLQSGSTGAAGFSGGGCLNCGVAINSLTNTAVLTVGLAGNSNGGIQVLDLATNIFSPPVPASGVRVSEDISLDPVRNLILSASEDSVFEIFQLGASGMSVFNQLVGQASPPQYELDATAEDCTTGIAIASAENVFDSLGRVTGTGGLFLTDLTQATFTPGTPALWTGQSQFQAIPEFQSLDGVAVAPGSQLGVAAQEGNGQNAMAAFRLPSASGTGLPAVQDWARAIIPSPGLPNGSSVTFSGADPHKVTAYTSPNDGKAYGLIADFQPFFLAIVDLAALLNLPRTPNTHVVDPSINLVTAGVVRFVPVSAFVNFPLLPNSGAQGTQNLAVEIKASATHFAQGTTTLDLGPGVAITTVTVNSPTELTALINIDPLATTGLRALNITTGTETLANINNAFTVNAGPAKITQLSPASAAQGQSVTATITGSGTHFSQGITTLNFNFTSSASTVTGITVNSPTSITATVNISPLEIVSLHVVRAQTGGEVATGSFNVTSGPATLTSVSPSSGSQGRQNLTINIMGKNTHFAQGQTTLSSDSFLAPPLTVNSPTSITAVVNISNVTPGPHSLTVQTGGEIATLTSGFAVTPGLPTLLPLSPPSLAQGVQARTVTISGLFTHFAQGISVADFGPGIPVTSLTIGSPTSATAVVSVDPLASLGTRNVSITSGSEVATILNGLTVVAGQALITSFSPSSLSQGQQNASVTITGSGSHFAQGLSTGAFGAGITVNSLTVNSPASATAVVSVDPAASGSRHIGVVTGGEVANSTDSLNVITGTPVLTRLTPASAQPGTQNVSVAITGLATHFAQGTSVANFGAGITVASLTINSPTSATAILSIDPAAALGPRNISVTTGAEVAAFNNGFLVAPLPPAVSVGLTEDQVITKLTPIIGTVSTGSWVLSYAFASQDGTGPSPVFVPFASGTSAVTNSVLGSFDPTLLLNGNYIIQLTSTDPFGQISTSTANVEVERNLKVGNFTLSFNDLNVPMPGLPITVTRTYDSRDKQSHDFGVGWTLSLANVRLQKNGALGAHWQMTQSGSGISTSFCLQESKPHLVTITFPDGRVFKFQETVTPQCQQISPIESATFSFVELPGASNTQGATLSIVGNNNVLVNPPSAGLVDLLDSVTTEEANPTLFQLTTAEGFVYLIDQSLGATRVTDPNGNQITINASGITSSDGKSIAFTRDTQGRITQIADPAGDVLSYGYSGTGDLTSFVDRVGNITTFDYDSTHLLTSIVDPRGVQAVKNVYDTSGRLTDTIDADGHDVHYDHQISANNEVITDRLGHVTTYEYDDDGNILHKIQTVAGVALDTVYTYDGNDNKLSELLPGHLNPSTFTYDGLGDQLTQTDPLGDQTKYAYNGNRQVTTIDDANLAAHHGTTTNAYDPATHNLLSTTDAEGHVTAYTYFPNGQVKTLSVDGVQTGSFVYDGTGNLQSQTDANGVATSYSYDANANRVSQTVKRTLADGTVQPLVTSYAYDANNRLTLTTYPDLTFAQIKYNAIGKQSDAIDPLGHTTHYDYDNEGRLAKTTYADGTFELTGYDLEGRRISFQDRALRVTTYDYDEIGRLTKTHYADTSFTETVYDGSGRVTDTFDALRNKTHYDYDDADRRTMVTDAAGNQTSFAYDNVGNQTAMTDALQHTTSFSYDRLGRRVLTTYHDQSTENQHYDFLGRMDSKTDQAGKVTQYGYDNVGRLKSVTQTLNNVALITSFGYDELGERISQTDANGHVTLFAYDQLGRRSSRTLPAGGSSETYAYDAAGNLKSKKDFNGHTTTYAYDNLNRLKSKTADVFFSTGACAGGACGTTQVSFTYTNTGRRLAMTDATGTTNYTYDPLDRLKSRATPFGTVSYTYDFGGNMLTLASSNAGGASMTYTYDPLNRLASVADASGTTTYGYDAVGNLTGYAYPNGVSTSYSYDPLNRLTNMQSLCGTAALGCGLANTPIASYLYTLGASGNRLSVAELSGRTVTYSYDDLYRLTSETVAADPRGNNGQVTYTLDNVGNRLQRNSTLPAIVPTGLLSYDANDRVSTDSFDANGNTTVNSGQTNVYDFENRLVQRGGVTIVYDGDGNRVRETVAGLTTSYLVADQNPTGYAQVVDELQNGAVSRTYSIGLLLISQRLTANGQGLSFYGYDGHGSVRFLTSSTGAITDTYDYDAFGNMISTTGSTPNNYLFAGEQFDPALAIYYNRARYYDQRQGRFWTLDMYEGDPESPGTLHKYLYARGDAVNRIDHSGRADFSLGGMTTALGNAMTIAGRSLLQARAVLGTIYYALGPVAPLIVEKGFTAIALGGALLYWAAQIPDGLREIDRLAYNVQSYQGGPFSAGWATRGKQVGRAAQQNLGDDFPVFDNFNRQTGEGTQVYSTNQIQSPEALIQSIANKASDFEQKFQENDIYSGYDANNQFVSFGREDVRIRNMVVTTPPIREFPLSRIAADLEKVEQMFGLEEIIIEESQSFKP